MTVERAVGRDPDCEERLPPPKEAEEARRLLAVVRNTLNCGRRIPRNWRVHLKELPGHNSARLYRQSRRGEESAIIESGIDNNRGEVRFIEADRYEGPRVYAHTPTAAKKVEEFSKKFRRSLRLPKPAKKTL